MRAPFLIDQRGVGEAQLGQPAAAYVRLPGTPRRDRIAGGLDRLTLPAHELAVLFRSGSAGAVGILSWSPRYTTAAGIGPCSASTALRRAYGIRLDTVARGGGLEALQLGRIAFAVDSDRFVRAVLVGDPAVLSPLVVLAVPPCGVPSV